MDPVTAASLALTAQDGLNKVSRKIQKGWRRDAFNILVNPLGFFDTDPEEELRKRKDAMISKINDQRTKRIAEITTESANQRFANQQGAMVRAMDSGRDPSDIEDSLIVTNQRSAQATNQALQQSQKYFDEQTLAVEGEYESRPLEAPLSDSLLALGETAIEATYAERANDRQQQYLDAYVKSLDMQSKAGVPSSGGSTPQPNAPVVMGSTATPSASPKPLPDMQRIGNTMRPGGEIGQNPVAVTEISPTWSVKKPDFNFMAEQQNSTMPFVNSMTAAYRPRMKRLGRN